MGDPGCFPSLGANSSFLITGAGLRFHPPKPSSTSNNSPLFLQTLLHKLAQLLDHLLSCPPSLIDSWFLIDSLLHWADSDCQGWFPMTLPSPPMYSSPPPPNLNFQQDAAGFGVLSPGSFGGPALLSLLREEDMARSTGKLPLNHCSSPGGLPPCHNSRLSFSLCTSCSHRSSSIPEQAWFSHSKPNRVYVPS